MNIQKLPWAGIRIESGKTAVVIDPLVNFPSIFGQPHGSLYPLDEFGPVDAVLVTHHHYDHFDPEAIAAYYGEQIPVYIPSEALELVHTDKLKSLMGVRAGDSFEVGELTMTATYSVDGVGDTQVAWIVQDGEKKIIHCGDTLWHGYWWKIAGAYGPFDAACLPVNGALLDRPGIQPPSGQPICLTPEQAVSAATILKAATLIPIHFGLVHHPPIYRQTPDVLERLRAAAENTIKLSILETKEIINL
jgi:L-ascorbate metabolism protein UlaG (beta-lactamase superfamily)